VNFRAATILPVADICTRLKILSRLKGVFNLKGTNTVMKSPRFFMFSCFLMIALLKNYENKLKIINNSVFSIEITELVIITRRFQ